MIRVENVIPMAAPVDRGSLLDFLQAVEADVATKVASGASGGFFSGMAGSTWSWIAGAGAVAITAGGVYVATQNNEPAPEPVAVVTHERRNASCRLHPSRSLPVVSAPVHEAPSRVCSTRTAKRVTIERRTSRSCRHDLSSCRI